ncbi:hypothetical protein ALC53_13824 [Atta colombica]|uniref:Uncharacterized protein n=1 Tax=Atta colombica TaxID=520822 RepID=A0A195AUA7_9HYME|nr:hypothetical protein ALC53_13824 [Atta colombica]
MLQMFSDIMDDYNTLFLKYHDKCPLFLRQRSLHMRVIRAELDYMLDVQETSLFEKFLTEIGDMFAEIAFLVEKQRVVGNKIISKLCSITKC